MPLNLGCGYFIAPPLFIINPNALLRAFNESGFEVSAGSRAALLDHHGGKLVRILHQFPFLLGLLQFFQHLRHLRFYLNHFALKGLTLLLVLLGLVGLSHRLGNLLLKLAFSIGIDFLEGIFLDRIDLLAEFFDLLFTSLDLLLKFLVVLQSSFDFLIHSFRIDLGNDDRSDHQREDPNHTGQNAKKGKEGNLQVCLFLFHLLKSTI